MRITPEEDEWLDKIAQDIAHSSLSEEKKDEIIHNRKLLTTPLGLILRVPGAISNYIDFILAQENTHGQQS